MDPIHSYACSDYPEMETCPGRFYAQTPGELWKHIELHASDSHGEDPAVWTDQDRALLKSLIKAEA